MIMTTSVWVHGPAGSGKTTLVENMFHGINNREHEIGTVTIRMDGTDFGSDNWKMSLGTNFARLAQINLEKQLVIEELQSPSRQEDKKAAFKLLASLATGDELVVDARHQRPQRVRFSRVYITSQATPQDIFPFSDPLSIVSDVQLEATKSAQQA